MNSIAVFFGIALSAVGATCSAQHYPTKAVRLLVPFAAGGASDGAARAVAGFLGKALEQPVVVDNRPGANGTVAAITVANAAPDGYTLLWGVSSMVAIPLLYKKPPFESFSAFAPVSLTGQFAFGMFVYPAIPARTPREFIQYARGNGNNLIYASATMSEYLAAVQFMKVSGASMRRVPYKGGAQAMPDLIAGRVQVYFTPVGVALPYAKEARLRMLGVLLPARSPAAPDVPTMAEAGLPGVSVPSWQAIFAPSKTAAAVIRRLSRETTTALEKPEVRLQLDKLIFQSESSTPERLAAIVARDVETWRAFIRDNDIPRE